MTGEAIKRTLPTESRMAIFRMRFHDRLTYGEISRRTGVGMQLVKDICRKGRLVDTGRHIRGENPITPPAPDIPTLIRQIDELHKKFCGDKPCPDFGSRTNLQDKRNE